MPKDEALQQAKLSYLAQSNGRTSAPQYWAGLVLIGDTTSIKIDKKGDWTWMWMAAGGLALILGLSYFYMRKRKQPKLNSA